MADPIIHNDWIKNYDERAACFWDKVQSFNKGKLTHHTMVSDKISYFFESGFVFSITSDGFEYNLPNNLG